MSQTVSRREFVRAGALAGAGLVLAIELPAFARRLDGATLGGDPGVAPFSPNAFLRIAPDESVTVVIGYSEMGQGVATSIPMLVAEELGADWRRVRVEFAPADMRYKNPLFGAQGTGGSTAVRGAFEPMRTAGAAAREMLVAAAAATWGVDASTCRAENGAVGHASGKRLTFGQLADRAAKVPVPEKPQLKSRAAWRILGTPTRRLDTAPKTDGSARFGIDTRLPGMLVAVVARSPVYGGHLASLDDTKARAVPGVRKVVGIPSGVAVIADGFWAAKKGRDALAITWNEGPTATVSSESIARDFAEAAKTEGVVARNTGDTAAALAAANGSGKLVEAVYELPYLAHATMEPMNCTASVRADACEVWAPTQFQTAAQGVAAKITGLPPERVTVHTTFLGGGFGRRAETDFVADAVELSKAVGAPVKVVWTREDDMRHDFYRPAAYNVARGAIGADGTPTALFVRAVSSSIFARFMGPQSLKDGIDGQAVEGLAETPYAIPNVRVEWVRREPGVPVGFWRSVGNSQNAFVMESFIDELAHAAGSDPLEFRRSLLGNAPRHKRVLELAAEKAGWRTPLPKGHFRGIAVHESFGSYVAEVAEVAVENDGRVRVHRVTCAVDCGTVVNPLTVEAQMQGGIVYGLTAALYGEITIDKGRATQGNFDTYRLLRHDEMPAIDVHIVPSTEPPGGVGEPGTPPIAPAVANAIFAATGQRIRKLPIRLGGATTE